MCSARGRKKPQGFAVQRAVPYRKTGNVMMAGAGDATVSVERNGQEIGTRKVAVIAK